MKKKFSSLADFIDRVSNVKEENEDLKKRINKAIELLKEFDYDKNDIEVIKYFIAQIINYLSVGQVFYWTNNKPLKDGDK